MLESLALETLTNREQSVAEEARLLTTALRSAPHAIVCQIGLERFGPAGRLAPRWLMPSR